MANSNPTKTCKKCRQDLPLSEFWKTGQGYYWGSCKNCNRAYHEKNRPGMGGEPIPEGTQSCRICNRELLLSMFYKQPQCTNGRWRQCKDCVSAKRKNRYRDRPANSPHWRKHKYGLAEGDYQKLFEKQCGRCAICGNPPGKMSLHIDHDHATGVVRGLLCGRCNRGIGMFRESGKLLRKAIRYLKAFESKQHDLWHFA